MVVTVSHTEPLQCSADGIWEACKHADEILPALMPDYFTKSVFLQGHGEPGSIRIVKMGPAIAHAGEVKERMDKFDDATKTLGYTVLEGDPRYSSFSAEMKFVPVGETSCEAIWTATYEPVGDMGPPEHIKQIVVLVFKTLEQAVLSRKTLSHTEVLAASPDAIWEACKHADELLPKAMPEFFASSTFLQGHGEPGSIRVVKMGPAVPHAGEVKERMDFFDDANKALGYTVLEGDPRYHYFSAVMKFVPGAAAGILTRCGPPLTFQWATWDLRSTSRGSLYWYSKPWQVLSRPIKLALNPLLMRIKLRVFHVPTQNPKKENKQSLGILS